MVTRAAEREIRGYGGDFPVRPKRMDPALELDTAFMRNLWRHEPAWKRLEDRIAGRNRDDLTLSAMNNVLSARGDNGYLVDRFTTMGESVMKLADGLDALRRIQEERIERLKTRGMQAVTVAAALVSMIAVLTAVWR